MRINWSDLRRVRMRTMLVLLMSLPSIATAHEGHPADICSAWFSESGISPVEPACMFRCTALPVNLQTYVCPSQCDHFCDPKDCANNSGLRRYREQREQGGAPYDSLTPAEIGAFEAMLTNLRNAWLDGRAAQAGSPIPVSPVLGNTSNIRRLMNGDRRAGVDIVYNIVFPPGVSDESANLPQMFDDIIDGLSQLSENGDSRKLQEIDDRASRGQVSDALSEAGCPSDLTNDWGLEPYRGE